MSQVYDATGLPKQAVTSVDWSDILNTPARVLEIAAIVDPNSEFYYVGWDDVANELRLRIFDPLNIPYDNSGSGLSATNVQDAIDELAALVNALVAGNVYAGYVGSDGTTGNRLPVGWSATRTGGGTYEVTHNLGLVDLTRLAFGPYVVAGAGNKNAYVLAAGSTGNKVVVNTIDPGTGSLGDQPFSFTAKLT